MKEEQLKIWLNEQQAEAEMESLRQENAAVKQEVEQLTQEVVQLEAALIEEQVKAKKREKTFKFIQLLSQEIIAATDADNIYQITVQSLVDKIGFDRAIVFKKQDKVFLPVALWGYSSDHQGRDAIASGCSTHAFFAQIAVHKNGILVNGKTEKIYPNACESVLQVRYFIAVPFAVDDEVNHILFAGNQTEDTLRRARLTQSDLETLQILANQIALAIRQAELYAETRKAAVKATAQAQRLKQTLHQLQHTQARLIQTEKMSSLGQLVAGIAHEINNPANFIKGNLSYIDEYIQNLLALLHLYQQQYPQPVASIQEAMEAMELDFITRDLPRVLSSMQLGTERIRQIVLSLQNFSRLDQAEMKPVNIHEGIDNTLLILHYRLKPRAGNSGIQVLKEYEDLPLVECYASQLNQVFMNIISNAIDALENQPDVRIIKICTQVVDNFDFRGAKTELTQNVLPIATQTKVKAQNSKGVIIKIADNGMGMTEEVRHRLFDPFFTTKPVGKGTGLGLSISYQIVVEKHGGILSCVSKPGQGAEFSIQIPVAPHAN